MQVINFDQRINFDEVHVGDIILSTFSTDRFVSSKLADKVRLKRLGSDTKRSVELIYSKTQSTGDIGLGPYSYALVRFDIEEFKRINLSYRAINKILYSISRSPKKFTLADIITAVNAAEDGLLSIVDLCNKEEYKILGLHYHAFSIIVDTVLTLDMHAELGLKVQPKIDCNICRAVVALVLKGRSYEDLKARYSVWYQASSDIERNKLIIENAFSIGS